MKKIVTLVIAGLLLAGQLVARQNKTENLIIVTLDGMRWQEVFNGVDKVLMEDSTFNHDREGVKNKFWAETPEQRREKLFPFLWQVVAQQGQLYGNRKYDNKIDNANPHWFSYPGYNEIFTGYPDTTVNSNDKILNKHENVLEFINKQKKYINKVAAFASWDVFPYILNEGRSGVYVNADTDTLAFDNAPLKLINDLQFLATRPSGLRQDALTYAAAREYLKAYKPKVLYIAFDETDHFAHAGMYDQYLGSAHAEDAMLRDIWSIAQSLPEYKGRTALVVTVDHGRGDKVKSNWKHHGKRIEDAHEIWLAVMGPDTPPTGEGRTAVQLYQQQIAATLAKLLGFTFTADHPIADPIPTVYKK